MIIPTLNSLVSIQLAYVEKSHTQIIIVWPMSFPDAKFFYNSYHLSFFVQHYNGKYMSVQFWRSAGIQVMYR